MTTAVPLELLIILSPRDLLKRFLARADQLIAQGAKHDAEFLS
jgi:hypothetical protein